MSGFLTGVILSALSFQMTHLHSGSHAASYRWSMATMRLLVFVALCFVFFVKGYSKRNCANGETYENERNIKLIRAALDIGLSLINSLVTDTSLEGDEEIFM